jgi:guanylate kinase
VAEPNEIFFIMGKSSTGKDTIFKRLRQRQELGLKAIIPYTTRPLRGNEENGDEYFFIDEAGFQELWAQGKIIEARAYATCHGKWRYFTVCDEQFDFAKDARARLMIGTLESYRRVKEYFITCNVIPILIELEDGTRLTRALEREKNQEYPKYEEMCRRFLADTADFADELIIDAGIGRRFNNEDLDNCEADIIAYIGDSHWISR